MAPHCALLLVSHAMVKRHVIVLHVLLHLFALALGQTTTTTIDISTKTITLNENYAMINLTNVTFYSLMCHLLE